MRTMRYAPAALAVALLGALATACGGGGHGLRVASNPITIQPGALPATLSGQVVQYCLPWTGGMGGPYRLDVIDGALPAGVTADSETVCLVGRALEDGVFHFTLRLTDTGSDPFTSSVRSYDWTIGIGPLVIATDPILPSWIFNRFDAVNLQVAGGVPPYSCQVVDDPANSNDEPLPVGLSIPPSSTTIVGAPSGSKPGGSPFVYRVTVEARDRADQPDYPSPLTVRKELTVTVLVPQVQITTNSLPNGKCGAPYVGKVDVAQGIPPFRFQVATALGVQQAAAGEPGTPGGLSKGAAGSAYAPEAAGGPYTGVFPEGVYFNDATGDMGGSPRRQGNFNDWVFWVQSQVLPSDPGQNKWRAFTFGMTDGAPSALALNPAFLAAGSNFTLAGPNALPEAEIGKAYSRTFLATGGVPADGRLDAPVLSKAILTATEAAGAYDWGATTLVGAPALSSLGLSLDPASGVLSGTPVVRTGSRLFDIGVKDYQLPTPASAAHSATGYCSISIGPDTVVITESTAAHDNSAITINTFRSLASGSPNNTTYEYNDQTLSVFEPYSSTPTVRAPSDALDLPAGHTVPAGGTLAGMLTSMDVMSLSVNPTWWAYDVYNLNEKGARALQRADLTRAFSSYAFGGDGSGALNSMNLSQGGSLPATYERDGDSCIELPRTTAVAHDPASGVYADGGQMYGFENATYFGVFVVRKDGKLYVPFALNKSTSGFEGFGDAVLTSDRAQPGVFRRPQITASPDGRFAAAKVKVDVDSFGETSFGERIAIWSLTGEKPFAGQTYRLIGTGGSGNTTDGQYLYGSSLALANDALYFLKGNNLSLSNSDISSAHRDHWVYKVDGLATGNAALLQPGFSPRWSNSAGAPLATFFHRWAPPHATSLYGGGTSTWGPSQSVWSSGSYLTTASIGTTSKYPPDFSVYHFANFHQMSAAPMPFRVSADGKACAILANTTSTAGTPTTPSFMTYSIFVDYQGAGTIREITSTQRHFMAPTRMAGCVAGEQQFRLWGWYTGPTTQFEISDDGRAVAAVYNAYTGTWYSSGSTNASRVGSYESLYVATAGGGSSDPWSSAGEYTPTLSYFSTSIAWRLGCLAWSRDGQSIVFWGGYSLYSGTSYSTSYLMSSMLSGSMYEYTPSTNLMEGILASSDGGHSNGIITYGFNSLVASTWSGSQGAIQPIGCFRSNDGNFFYVQTIGALTNGAGAGYRLIGVNLASTTINARSPLRGFAMTWPNARSFGPTGTGSYSSTVNPNGAFNWGAGNANNKAGSQVSVAGTGVIYVASYSPNSTNQGTNDSTTTFSGGGPANTTPWDGNNYTCELMAMDANVGGGPAVLTNLGSLGTWRVISHIQPSGTGRHVVVTTQTTPSGSSMSWMDNNTGYEQMFVVRNVGFTSTGALAGPAPVQIGLETTNGRASTAVAWDFSENRLYYGWIAGTTSNENQQVLTEATFTSGGTSVTRRTQPGRLASAARFAVLHSGR